MVFPIPTDSQLQFSSITALVHTEGIYFIMKAHFQVEYRRKRALILLGGDRQNEEQ